MGLKAVVIDDIHSTRQLLKLALGKMGWEVFTFHAAPVALEFLKTVKPSGIFLDLQLPQMDGIQALRHIRALPNNSNTPVVIITGKRFEQDKREAEKMGVYAYLTKPIDPGRLRQVVDAIAGMGKIDTEPSDP